MKPKLLLLASRFPYPLIGGDRIKLFATLEILSCKYEIYFVLISHTALNKEDIARIEPLCKELKIFYKSKFSSYLKAFRAIFSGESLQVGYYYFSDVAHFINTLLQKEQINIAISVLIRTAKYMLDKNLAVNIVDITDSIAINYKRSMKNTQSLFWKSIYFIESRRLAHFETKCVESFDASLFVNKFEALAYKDKGNAILIPHGSNEALLNYTPNTKKQAQYKNAICFFGKMDYQPNIDACLYFAHKVMPLLAQSKHKFRFLIIGANPSEKILSLQSTQTQILGFVQDPYEILSNALCIVAPMQSGGGIQNKILESLALGQIVVTNNLGANPIYQAKDKEHLLLANTPQEFADTILQIAQYPESYNALKNNARALIRQNYTWQVFGEKLLGIIKHIKDSKC
ncbi:glycosyltransferase [Helicobacter himalayensis]|uniref:glycosyltransferase n=1 Tax=Helicobacter himalayensis TaxID=1591088 RepID=UPI003D6DB789